MGGKELPAVFDFGEFYGWDTLSRAERFVIGTKMTISPSPKIRAKVGDVFLIPIDETTWVVGQLVRKKRSELYVAIFADRYSSTEVEPRSILDKKPLFLVLTLDVKLYHGMWPIIGNVKENLNIFPEPAFKIAISGHAHIVSRDETICRLATEAELEVLKLHSVRSGQGIENMVRSYFGTNDDQEDFDYFLATYAENSGKLLQEDR